MSGSNAITAASSSWERAAHEACAAHAKTRLAAPTLCTQCSKMMHTKWLGHRVALFVALLLFVFQLVAVQPGYTHWASIEKEVDHPIDCSELDCYGYDKYEVNYGLFDAREKFCGDCDNYGSYVCSWETDANCRSEDRRKLYASGDEVDLDDADLLDDLLSEEEERRLYGGYGYGYGSSRNDPKCCSRFDSEIDVNEEYGNTLFCGPAARQYAKRIRDFCQDFLVITSQTRQMTYASLLIAVAVLLGFGWNYFVMIRQQQQNPSPRVVAGLAALLTVGGVVGLAGTASYWETMVKLADDIQGYVRGHGYDKTDVCLWGCEMSLASSAIATFAGLAVVALEVKMNPEAFKRGPAKPTKPDDAPPALAPIATQKTEVKRQQTPVAKPESLAEPPAEAEERPGRARNLFSYVFGSEAEGEIGQEPATEESVAIEMEPTTMREQEELEPEC
jgi:hypothetical protein